MSNERELLIRANAFIGHALPRDLQEEISQILAKPERQPLTDDEIVGYLKKSQLDYLNENKQDCIELYGTKGEGYEIPVYLSPNITGE